ncbi:hypothetical protein AV530_002037 [Patagioenas fasciata monilis]|uniref:Uncharacterized protein n=1 Tax=Patagioenas fasciata monilis TaxID=372326 RepID=A0A1V4J6Y8_PATFA|nr:hypothetical protein AV530_002037 [Patagioenas fasciata monilis]
MAAMSKAGNNGAHQRGVWQQPGGRGGGSGPEQDGNPLPAPGSGAGTNRDSRRPASAAPGRGLAPAVLMSL